MIRHVFAGLIGCTMLPGIPAIAQQPPTDNDVINYRKLQAAAYRNDADRISQFVAEGDDLERRDENGRTPVIISAFQRSYDALDALVDAGADVNAADNDGHTALTIGLAGSDDTLVDLTKSLGINVDEPSGPDGDSPLASAVRRGEADLVQSLLSHGPDLDFINAEGDAPLHIAVKFLGGDERAQAIVKTLLGAGARPGLKNADGLRPRQIARELGYEEILQIYRDFRK